MEKKTKYENKLNLLESKRCQFENVMWAWNDDISKCLGWPERRKNIPKNMLSNELMDQRYTNWVFDEPTWLRIGAVCANVRIWYLNFPVLLCFAGGNLWDMDIIFYYYMKHYVMIMRVNVDINKKKSILFTLKSFKELSKVEHIFHKNNSSIFCFTTQTMKKESR